MNVLTLIIICLSPAIIYLISSKIIDKYDGGDCPTDKTKELKRLLN